MKILTRYFIKNLFHKFAVNEWGRIDLDPVNPYSYIGVSK
jgi:hypothetical protein